MDTPGAPACSNRHGIVRASGLQARGPSVVRSRDSSALNFKSWRFESKCILTWAQWVILGRKKHFPEPKQ